jgi:predicted deacylase
LLLTAAVHGDELNGVSIIHHLAFGADHLMVTEDDHIDVDELAGTVLCVPVVNVEGMILQSRHTPDGRDLNRLFPGKDRGNQAQRIAAALFEKCVRRADYLIDLHTAPQTRTNVPHVRADFDRPECKALARAFGTEIVLHSTGVPGTLRRAAADAGVAAILMESGTSHRFESGTVQVGVRGILNAMAHLGMLKRKPVRPAWRLLVRRSRWIRAADGGLLHTMVNGGDLVRKGERIATVTDPVGSRKANIISPVTGLVLGLATTPLVRAGDPIANVVIISGKRLKQAIDRDTVATPESGPTQEAEVADRGGDTLDEVDD